MQLVFKWHVTREFTVSSAESGFGELLCVGIYLYIYKIKYI